MEYKVWTAKIVLDDTKLPDGFDSLPRRAAIEAIEHAGFDVVTCFSGWGGKLTKSELECLVRDAPF